MTGKLLSAVLRFADFSAKPTLRPTDTELDEMIKRTTMPLACVCAVCLAAVAACKLPFDDAVDVAAASGVASCVLYYWCGASGALDASSNLRLWIFSALAESLLADWAAAYDMNARVWLLAVPMLDLCLALRTSHTVTLTVLVVTILWIGFTLLDIDVVGIVPQSFRDVVSASGAPSRCTCAHPPCAVGAFQAFYDGCFGVLMLLTDFYITREFAQSMHAQMRAVRSSVQASQKIATHLARYEIELAESAAAQHSELPADLADAFSQLLQNLREYRSYLPMSCLSHEDCGEDEVVEFVSVPALPGTPLRTMRRTDSTLSARSAENNSDTLSEGDMSDLSRIHSIAAARHHVRRRHVSALCVNHVGFLRFTATADAAAAATWLSTVVTNFVAAVTETKGVVDLFNGDHLFSSFNGARSCPGHRHSALRLATATLDQNEGPLKAVVAVASGAAICGDFGSASSVRYMLLGPLSSELSLLERAATRVGKRLVINDGAAAEISRAWLCRLWLVWRTARIQGVLLAWEPIRPVDAAAASAGGPAEWMYEVVGDHHPWAVVNEAVRDWSCGEPAAAAASLSALISAAAADDEVVAAAEEVLRGIRSGRAAVATVEAVGGDFMQAAGGPSEVVPQPVEAEE